ncbi:glutathione S-transferase [Sphingomonas sp. PAMC 26605]|uniref:glutathione S-transferase n=1 Tax=Sphingomonas sp. PAMC 26605 TaxID=1112214 RepID=UPI00026CCB1F|nr:glutathione S-transferase [Sphingomonas sp. PAMC 26605]
MTLLYSFRRCPYAMRARLALLASGAPFELREIVLRDKPAAMLAASPKGTVPVLQLDDGRVIDESLDIMLWALGRNDPERWLAGYDAALVETFDTRFKHHLDRYKYAERYAADPIAHRDAGLALLVQLDARLSDNAHLCGAQRGLSDIAIFPFVRQFAAVDPGWFAALPIVRVQHWLARHVASPLFEQAMLRLPPWAPGDPPFVVNANT